MQQLGICRSVGLRLLRLRLRRFIQPEQIGTFDVEHQRRDGLTLACSLWKTALSRKTAWLVLVARPDWPVQLA